MPSQALYNLATKGWTQVSSGCSAGAPEDVVSGGEEPIPQLAAEPTSDTSTQNANVASGYKPYNSDTLQDCREKREKSRDRLEKLQKEHQKLVQRAMDVIDPHQAPNPVVEKDEPAWAREPPARPSARPASRRSHSAPVTPRPGLRASCSVPSTSQATSVLVTPPTTSRASNSSTSLFGAPVLATASRRTRSNSLPSDELELMDECTFQPNIKVSRRRKPASEPPVSRPTKASILRDHAVLKRQEESRVKASPATPPYLGLADSESSPVLSRQSSSNSTATTVPTATTVLSTNMTTPQQRVLEGKLADDVEEAQRAVHRKVDIIMSTRSAHEVRAFNSQLNRLLAAGDKERRCCALEERRQKDAADAVVRQDSAKMLKDEVAKGTQLAQDAVKVERAIKGTIGRDERKVRDEAVYQEEKALLKERRSHVRKMQELENVRARLLQEWRARDIQKKRSKMVELRKELEEQHQTKKTADEQEADEKRQERKRERVRKYEDLLGRAKHLEELRELDRALSEQIQNDMQDLQVARDRRVQDAREQAMLEMETRFMEKRHQLRHEQSATLERLAGSSNSTPKSSPRTPRSRKRTPESSPGSDSSRRLRELASPRSTAKSPALAAPMSSNDRYRAEKISGPHETPSASPSNSSIVERLCSARTRTLTTRAQQPPSPRGSRQAEEALQMSDLKSGSSMPAPQTPASMSASEGFGRGAEFLPYGGDAGQGSWLYTPSSVKATPNTSSVDMTFSSPMSFTTAVPTLQLSSPTSPRAYAQASPSRPCSLTGASSATTAVPASTANAGSALLNFSPNVRAAVSSPANSSFSSPPAKTPTSCSSPLSAIHLGTSMDGAVAGSPSSALFANPAARFGSFSPSVVLPVHGGLSGGLSGSRAGSTTGNL